MSIYLTQEQAEARHIRKTQYVSCDEAFLDCRLPGSMPKENYSIIGPGVTQSASQVVNLKELHGFNIGAAAMPHGVTNNLHIHFTSEVFICTRGEWLLRWGPRGEEGEYVLKAGDIVCLPTWIFRGFTNVGPDDGWLFSCLGGDDTGGVIWSPDIMGQANETGLYLAEDNQLIDRRAGQILPPGLKWMAPFPAEEVARLRKVSPQEMRGRVTTAEDRAFSSHALLDACLPGHASQLAPVIGYGITQDRNQRPRVQDPQGFSIEWMRLPPGQEAGPFLISQKMVVICIRGSVRVAFNEDVSSVVELQEQDTLSIPGEVWRCFANASGSDVELLLICAGDERKRPRFTETIQVAVGARGVALDASDYLCRTELMPSTSHWLK